MDKNFVINRLNELLEEKNLSINAVTEKAGLAKGTVYKWYTKTQAPRIETLSNVCDALGISLSDFFATDPQDIRKTILAEVIETCNTFPNYKLEALRDFANTLKKL